MSTLRGLAKSCLVGMLGTKSRPRLIFWGLARGYRIVVSPAQNLGYLFGTAEPHLQRIIREYVVPGDTVYDIGGCIGYVSLSLAKRVGPSGRVIAFEPLPVNCDSFRKNMEMNGLDNVQLMEVAASSTRGEAVIRSTANSSMASLVWHSDNPSAAECNVKTVSVDELVGAQAFGYPTFIKIDVEDSEGMVLQGMLRTIAAAKPVIFIECSDIGREKSWTLLRELGYLCHSAITRKVISTFDGYRHSDFLWLPHAKRPPNFLPPRV